MLIQTKKTRPSIKKRIKFSMNNESHYQVAIIGGGPAGHTAAIYTARADLNVVMFEGEESPGGQLTTTTVVENFPGFPKGIDGYDLMQRMKEQSQELGVQVISKNIEKINMQKKPFEIHTKDESFVADAVIVASGSTAKILPIPGAGNGENEYWQKGVSACAVCDGALPMFRNKPLYVVGGGDTAMEEAIFLAKFGSEVYIVHRRDEFRASKIMVHHALNNPKIKVLYSHIVAEVKGNGKLVSSVVVKNLKTDQLEEKPAAGLFMAIGHTPNTAFLEGQVDLDADGYIITVPGSCKTSVEGIFAAGDVQDKVYRQAILSAGTGCMAALDANAYLTLH